MKGLFGVLRRSQRTLAESEVTASNTLGSCNELRIRR
jgi:hypothetical protein